MAINFKKLIKVSSKMPLDEKEALSKGIGLLTSSRVWPVIEKDCTELMYFNMGLLTEIQEEKQAKKIEKGGK